MPTTTEILMPPQTAAELLGGLLHSQLLAESLFGQVFEQSRPYLDRPAGEYVVALVEKRVLTPWQATELLAGRICLFAGTFRLLERLARTDDAQLFVAEQAGPQRLVLLQITRTVGVGDPSAEDCSAEIGPVRKSPRHPHLAHCIAVQQTPQLGLVAYEFLEAKPLSEILAANPIKRSHAAQLVRQFASALADLREEIIETIGLPAVWIDTHGQLKLLARPNPLASDPAPSQRSPQREALQLAAVNRFAVALGGLPEMADCRLMIEVVQRLSEIAEPWATPFASASLRCPRSRMNRYLRRGPALRLIETLGEELQLVLDETGEEILSSRSLDEGLDPTESEAALSPIPPAVRGRSRRRAWAVSVVLLLIVAAVIATRWAERWGVRPAEATTEELETSPAKGR